MLGEKLVKTLNESQELIEAMILKMPIQDRVDLAARLSAHMRRWASLDEILKQDFKSLNQERITGETFEVSIVQSVRVSLDTKALKSKLDKALWGPFERSSDVESVYYKSR